MTLKKSDKPLSLEHIEPSEDLFKRFDSAAMSIGALSPEAHEALATAMNRLGGYSNSGEGGEDPRRFGTEQLSVLNKLRQGDLE